MIGNLFSSLMAKLKGSLKVVREVLYGLMLHEMDLEMEKEKGHLDNLFMLIIFGDLIGLPLLPPYYSLRLLPHIIPSLETWKRSSSLWGHPLKGTCQEKKLFLP